ncbi:S-layer homology domain-containing protein [Bacillus cereus]|uniref:S-layer homology domain-containing protein n=1 Tax=Bacillus cereus TaxID=1396 RepID=UPI001C8D35D7|nr:S-layer homology domain-containing protein [Bacillus cereus]MBY0130532.1 S-layer homology domain-containing protein [Bacillus cereus]
MKKKILGVMMIATMAGGIFAGTNVTPVKAEEYPQMIVFEDVPYGFWAYDAIMDLAYHKIILGYGNGKYGVGDLITREQVAGTIYRTLEIKEEGPVANPYKDVSDSTTTFKKEILALTKRGVFSGDGQGNFRPKAPISRAEMAVILKRAFHFETKQKHTFKDIPKGHWAEDAISAVQTNGITMGIGEGKFGPSMKVTREQYAQFLHRAILHDMEQGQ